MLEKLKEIRDTLNEISVSGEQNLYYLLGCIQELNSVIENFKEDGETVENG